MGSTDRKVMYRDPVRYELFICPVCSGPLTPDETGRTLRCGNGHSFDIARQGYASLITGGSHITGDTAAMVRARIAFLGRGLYEPIIQELTALVTDYAQHTPTPHSMLDDRDPSERSTSESPSPESPILADLGGGTGYYSSYILDALPQWEGVLLDVSSSAAKAAAKAHPRLTVATADLRKSIPLADSSVDVALDIFAPRNPSEIMRILKPGGVCLVVTPTQDHLRELRAVLPMLEIAPNKESHLASQFAAFILLDERAITYTVHLPHEAVEEVVGMGPSAFHIKDVRADIADLPDELNITVAVEVHQYQRTLPS